MIVFFGQPGAGKTTQGKMLAASQGWCWISAGQVFRDSDDPEIHKIVEKGELVPYEKICKLVGNALDNCPNTKHVIIDGFARQIEQARWLVEESVNYNRAVELIIVINISKQELVERLILRGREDDTRQVIENRLDIYEKQTYPVLEYFKEQNVKIAYIDGLGTPEQVHERIMKEIKECKLA